MTARRALFGALIALSAQMASAGDWYDRVSTKMERIEQHASGVIYLLINTHNNGGAAVTVTGHNGTCNVTSIRLTPPAGKEKEWLTMVLAATMSGNAISVYGDCIPANWEVHGTRILVEY